MVRGLAVVLNFDALAVSGELNEVVERAKSEESEEDGERDY